MGVILKVQNYDIFFILGFKKKKTDCTKMRNPFFFKRFIVSKIQCR